MNVKVVITDEHPEEVVIYSREKTALIEKIEQLISEEEFELIGYKDREGIRLLLSDIYCFTVEANKIYAITENDKLYLRCRLYNLAESLPDNFIKINQSAIANIQKIRKFDASVLGSLTVEFKNGYRDYVSRRNIKKVKERLGL